MVEKREIKKMQMKNKLKKIGKQNGPMNEKMEFNEKFKLKTKNIELQCKIKKTQGGRWNYKKKNQKKKAF